MKNRFLDQSIAVREAAVDLIGKYVLSKPELIDQYYNMIVDRIRVGIGVANNDRTLD